MKDWSLIVVAAGRGSRMGGVPKQFRPLGGYPLWHWSLALAEALHAAGDLRECVLVVPPADPGVETAPPPGGVVPVVRVEGGAERGDSVLAGVRAASGAWVMVHDAARPFCSLELCRRLQAAAEASGGAIPLVSVADAPKKVSGGTVTPLPREGVFGTQTPQAFFRERLLEALERSSCTVRDEAEAWIAAGHNLTPVEGERENFKLTYEGDWHMAELMVAPPQKFRVGHGFDIHPLVPERRLILAGMTIPSPLGLDGHSDADLVAHAVADALLGAAGLPDLGRLFPASDQRYKGARSMDLLGRVVDYVRDEGWEPEWVDVTLEAQLPRLGPLCDAMGVALDDVLRCGEGPCCHVKVKSAEKIGALGRGEALACHAVALLGRRKSPRTGEQ